jgi:hypothetical protein
MLSSHHVAIYKYLHYYSKLISGRSFSKRWQSETPRREIGSIKVKNEEDWKQYDGPAVACYLPLVEVDADSVFKNA